MPFSHFTGFNLWLLKPTKLNRGRGIHVINNLSQLKQLIQRYCEGWAKPTAVCSNTSKTTTNFAGGASNIQSPSKKEHMEIIENGKGT
jgi:hypothetical protein